METIAEVLTFILSYPGIIVLRVNDRFSNSHNGWADCAVYVTSADKQYKQVVGEIQIVHKNMKLVREEFGAHDVYDDTRFGAELLKHWYGKDSETVPWSLLEQASQRKFTRKSSEQTDGAGTHSQSPTPTPTTIGFSQEIEVPEIIVHGVDGNQAGSSTDLSKWLQGLHSKMDLFKNEVSEKMDSLANEVSEHRKEMAPLMQKMAHSSV